MGGPNYRVIIGSSLLEVLVIIATPWILFAKTDHPIHDGLKYSWLVLGIVLLLAILAAMAILYYYCCCNESNQVAFAVANHCVLIILAAVKDIMLIISLIKIPTESCGGDVVEGFLLAIKITGGLSVLASLFHHLKFHHEDSFDQLLVNGIHLLPHLLSFAVSIYSLAHPCS